MDLRIIDPGQRDADGLFADPGRPPCARCVTWCSSPPHSTSRGSGIVMVNRVVKSSGRSWGELRRRELYGVRCSTEAGVPAVKASCGGVLG